MAHDCPPGGAVSFMLFLIRDLDNPFQGDWRVTLIRFSRRSHKRRRSPRLRNPRSTFSHSDVG
jgi:hypothetical protein